MSKITKKIELQLERKEGSTYLKFKVDPAIVKIYEGQSDEVRESQSWPGLKFFYSPKITGAHDYRNLLANYNLSDDFGSPIFQNRVLNIAFLRTVAGEGSIKIKDSVSIAEMSNLIRNITAFLKEYFNHYFRDALIKGTVNIEL